jgi:tetratricopeptide repeat protein 21B
MALGESAEALKSINKVLEFDPKNEDAYILGALISSKSGNYSAA